MKGPYLFGCINADANLISTWLFAIIARFVCTQSWAAVPDDHGYVYVRLTIVDRAGVVTITQHINNPTPQLLVVCAIQHTPL